MTSKVGWQADDGADDSNCTFLSLLPARHRSINRAALLFGRLRNEIQNTKWPVISRIVAFSHSTFISTNIFSQIVETSLRLWASSARNWANKFGGLEFWAGCFL